MSDTEKIPSLSTILEKHSLEILQKFESQLPLHVKSFSDFSREYINALKEAYNTGYIIENKIYGNCGLDEKSLRYFDNYADSISKFFISQIDLTTEFWKSFLTTRLSLMNSYAGFLKNFSSNIEISNS